MHIIQHEIVLCCGAKVVCSLESGGSGCLCPLYNTRIAKESVPCQLYTNLKNIPKTR